jgi:hypothetical protein
MSYTRLEEIDTLCSASNHPVVCSYRATVNLEELANSNSHFAEEHAPPFTSGQVFPRSVGISPALEAAKMAALPENPNTVTSRDCGCLPRL